MQDRQTGDQPFIEMMHDYLTTYHNRVASTEDFQRMAEKHMRPGMDLEKDGHLNWVLRGMVYGTDVPSLPPGLHAGRCGWRQDPAHTEDRAGSVGPLFKMIVPVYLDYDGKLAKLGTVPLSGNSTSNELKSRWRSVPAGSC